MESVQPPKFVGPVLRAMNQDIIEALLTAIEADNPDAELLYEDHGGYVRIHAPWRCRVTRKSLDDLFDWASWNLPCPASPDACALWAMRYSSGIWNGRISDDNGTPA
jgi:hypothetical protein